MPAHLQLTLLNVPPALDAQAVLPRPQHVILNHVYCQRGQVRRMRRAFMLRQRSHGPLGQWGSRVASRPRARVPTRAHSLRLDCWTRAWARVPTRNVLHTRRWAPHTQVPVRTQNT